MEILTKRDQIFICQGGLLLDTHQEGLTQNVISVVCSEEACKITRNNKATKKKMLDFILFANNEGICSSSNKPSQT